MLNTVQSVAEMNDVGLQMMMRGWGDKARWFIECVFLHYRLTRVSVHVYRGLTTRYAQLSKDVCLAKQSTAPLS